MSVWRSLPRHLCRSTATRSSSLVRWNSRITNQQTATPTSSGQEITKPPGNQYNVRDLEPPHSVDDKGELRKLQTLRTIKQLIYNGELESAERMYELASKEQPLIDKLLLVMFFRANLAKSNIKQAVEFINKMKLHNLSVDVVLIEDLIRTLLISNKVSAAIEIFQSEIVDNQRDYDKSYLLIVDYLMSINKTKDATDFIIDNLDNKIIPKAIVFETVINRLIQLDKPVPAENLFQVLRKRFINLPHVVEHNIIIAYVRRGLLQNAREMFDRLTLGEGNEPACALVTGYVLADKIDEALSLTDGIALRRWTSLDEPTYAQLIIAELRRNRAFGAENVMRKMPKNISELKLLCIVLNECHKYVSTADLSSIVKRAEAIETPNLQLLNALLGYFAVINKGDKVKEILALMESNNMTANVTTYNHLIIHNIDNPKPVLIEMANAGVAWNVTTLVNLFRYCAIANDVEFGRELIVKQQKLNIAANYELLEVQAKYFQKTKNLNQLAGLYEYVVSTLKHRKSVSVYNCLILICRLRKEYELAKFHFGKMQEVGIKPNIRTYFLMIRMTQSIEEVKEYCNQIQAENLIGDPHFYESLVKVSMQYNDLSFAVSCVVKCIKDNNEKIPPKDTVKELYHALQKAGMKTEAGAIKQFFARSKAVLKPPVFNKRDGTPADVKEDNEEEKQVEELLKEATKMKKEKASFAADKKKNNK